MRNITLSMILSLLTVVGLANAAPNIPAKPHGARIQNTTKFSSNWSGYTMVGRNLTDVRASWVVPTAVSSSYKGQTYSSTWTGLDGWSSSTVEQLGTEQDYDNTTHTASYYAWVEMFPGPGYYVTFPNDGWLTPGDVITAEVRYLYSGWFELSMLNSTKGWYFYTYQRSLQAQRTSAEVITEAPWLNGVLPLADFVVNTFNGCSVASNGAKPVGISRLPVFPVIMDGATDIKAFPGSIFSGDGFTDTWLNNE